MSEIINVNNFGGSDYQKIQAAINAAEAIGGGTVFLPPGEYVIDRPLVCDSYGVNLQGSGNMDGNADITTIFLDSDTEGDYALKYTDTSYNGGNAFISDIKFKGTNNANNQGGILFAGRMSGTVIQRVTFHTFTGYAIGRDPSTTSYTQNNAIRDVQFYSVGGCYGLITEPENSSNYQAESLLTLDNINLDYAINPTDPKPYVWDFRASRGVNCGIILNEGTCPPGVTATFAFTGDSNNKFDYIWDEFSGTLPSYLIACLDDTNNKFYGSSAGVIRVGSIGYSNTPVRIDNGPGTEIHINDWFNISANEDGDLVSFGGSSGYVKIENLVTNSPWTTGESLRGRLEVDFAGSVYKSSRRVVRYGSSAPAAGTWIAGDRVYNTAPTAGGSIGWVCVSGGSPGTWKTFGDIAT